MDDCLFCKIMKGKTPSTKVYEDENVYAFNDIDPQAPVHVIIIPKEHICCANKINKDNSKHIAAVYEAAPKIAKQLGLEESGYRIINNCGPDAGQTVFHIHFHLMGGKQLGWP